MGQRIVEQVGLEVYAHHPQSSWGSDLFRGLSDRISMGLECPPNQSLVEIGNARIVGLLWTLWAFTFCLVEGVLVWVEATVSHTCTT